MAYWEYFWDYNTDYCTRRSRDGKGWKSSAILSELSLAINTLLIEDD